MKPETGGAAARKSRVREARCEDVGSIARIDAASRVESWSEGAFRGLWVSDSRHCWVAERVSDGRVVGFLVATVVADQAEIDTICVDSDCRRLGLASTLFRTFCRLAREKSVRSVFLEVRASNDAAKSFYADLGFVPVGTRRRYYRDGEDAHCLRLDFDD